MSISWRQQSSTSGNRCCPSDWSYDGIAGLGYRREGKRDRTLLAEQGIFVESGENCVCHAKNVSQEVRVIRSKFLFSSHLTPRCDFSITKRHAAVIIKEAVTIFSGGRRLQQVRGNR